MKALLAAAVCLMGAVSCAREPLPLAADRVFKNAQIWTGVPSAPPAEALATRGSEIIAVGTTQEVMRYVDRSTELVDLGGLFMMPGFIDNHTHFVDGGFQLLGVDLRSARNEEEFAERIRKKIGEIPAGSWITGGDWDHESWPSAQLPTKALVDSFSLESPVFVSRYDGHMALANSLVLKQAGITRRTADPPGGIIVKDEKGDPTGILKDAAMDLVYRVMPQRSEAELREATLAALALAAEVGLTTVNVMASFRDVSTFQEILKEDKLTARIYAITPIEDLDGLRRLGVRQGFGNDFLKIGAVKGFVDGSLGSTTAWFYEPYEDEPATSGLPSATWFPEGNLRRLIQEADASGLQAAIHAIGDRANDELLEIFQAVIDSNQPNDRRFRIEHAQHLKAAALSRFRDLGVIASVQPYHAIDDGRWAEKRIGPERIKTTYPFRSLMDAGALVTFGSDWTVAPLNPVLGVYAAVTRRTLDGKNPDGWVPEEKISVEEALTCYTRNNAYAIFMEKQIGTLEAGKLADLVVLDRNPFEVDPVELDKLQVVRTVVGGRTVFNR